MPHIIASSLPLASCTLRPSHTPFSLDPSLPLAAWLRASCRPTQWTPCVYTVLASCTGYCVGPIHAWHRYNSGLRQRRWPSITFSERAPTTNTFLTKSKTSDDRHVQQIRHKHGRRSYPAVGVSGDSDSLLELEPNRSKDKGSTLL